jgi:glycosyltransferase involved in cell wall biosynthesis
MLKDSNVLFFSRFSLDGTGGGGGVRRERQITGVLLPLNYQFITAKDFKPGKPNLIKKRITIGKDRQCWVDNFKDYLYHLRRFSKHWAKRITRDIDLVIIDDPIYFASLVKQTKKLNIPLVAACQNIESLSLSQVNPAKQDRLFRMELQLLSMVDLIISISREETFLLKNLNMNVHFLPYYPVDSSKERLLTIRENRKKTKKSGILILGTMNNYVTRDGMIKVIDFWKKNANPKAAGGQKLYIVGYGTEKLRDVSLHKSIEFMGALEESKLEELLYTIKACLCYQDSGAGALTKISEMLIAGIPVLANSHAARSYYNMKGLIEFHTLKDLKSVMPGIEKWEGNIPVPGKPNPDILLKMIDHIVKNKKYKPNENR